MGEDTKDLIIEEVNSLREDLLDLEKRFRDLTDLIKRSGDVELKDKGECIAQSIIAFRDLENSRMRLGKILQYVE